ncbi:MAG: mannitol-1-phosphate 5-dehydrogenase [Candidatus Kerfeldbacteria bacterium]|nr:mannitol-1-phosphate 5-dehydrogenase [Candidatus Kerfeldbacteria bacterium]
MHAVIFGAGNIGRGFLGLLLRNAGYEITFIDVDLQKVHELQTRKAYPVYIVSKDGVNRQVVTDVFAHPLSDRPTVVNALNNADLILTAVGKDALAAVAPLLTIALQKRIQRGNEAAVTVVACENVHDNTQYLRKLVIDNADTVRLRELLGEIAVYPNCVVDRIVPNVLPVDDPNPLAVAVEDYFQFAIDGSMLGRKGFPAIPGVQVVSDLAPTLEQKLCTLNAAHAIVAYYGFASKYQYVHEAVKDDDIQQLVHGMLREVEFLLTRRHPSISIAGQRMYARKVLARFENPYLRDEVTRVARQPKRKLSADDRLVKPARLLAAEQDMQPVYLATGITAALHYDFHGDSQAQELVSDIREQGVARVLQHVAGIDPASDLGRMVTAGYVYRGL